MTAAWSHAAIIWSHSARFIAIGFSTTTCFLRGGRVARCLAVEVVGEAEHDDVDIGEVEERAVFREVEGDSAVGGEALAWPGEGDATATTSTPGIVRKASKWIEVTNPDPRSPTRTVSLGGLSKGGAGIVFFLPMEREARSRLAQAEGGVDAGGRGCVKDMCGGAGGSSTRLACGIVAIAPRATEATSIFGELFLSLSRRRIVMTPSLDDHRLVEACRAGTNRGVRCLGPALPGKTVPSFSAPERVSGGRAGRTCKTRSCGPMRNLTSFTETVRFTHGCIGSA